MKERVKVTKPYVVKVAPKQPRGGKGVKTLPRGVDRRRRAGTRALQEIRRFQKSVELLIPKQPFLRLIREIVASSERSSFEIKRLKKDAVVALQEAAESELVSLLEYTNLAAIHANRVTIQPKDIKFIKRIKNIL